MPTLTDPALEVLDRDVRRAVDATVAWHERLARPSVGDAFPDQPPLAHHRSVAGKLAYDELATRDVVSQDAAWRTGLLRWVGALTVLRVTEEQRLEEARVETDPSTRVRLEKVEEVGFRAAWKRLVGSTTAAEAEAWLEALAERGPAVAAARRERAARAEEAVHRLGVGSFSELVGGDPVGTLDVAARTFLKKTRDLARAVRRDAARKGDTGAASLVSAVLAAGARGAPEGWPSRLTTRALVETLRAPHDLGRGLRVRIHLPEAAGAASFARALEALGGAYRRAAASASRLPFAITVAPYFVDEPRFGFAFGALATLPAYHRHGLGVVARVAADQARLLTETALVHARSVAMASLLSQHAARPDRSLIEELTSDVYGQALPARLAGAFPRARGDEHQRLAALLTTLPFLTLLRDRFEEDWFRNPKAWQYLRGRAAGPALGVDEALAKPDPDALARAFEQALG